MLVTTHRVNDTSALPNISVLMYLWPCAPWPWGNEYIIIVSYVNFEDVMLICRQKDSLMSQGSVLACIAVATFYTAVQTP